MDSKKEDIKNKDIISKEETNESKETETTQFIDYIQCFRNNKAKELMNDPRYAALKNPHKFWDTQPVLKPGEKAQDSGAISPNIPKEKVCKEPTKLPDGFEWRGIDLLNDKEMKEIYILLYENYVEDDDGHFRFNYSSEFLRWALLPPGWNKDLYFGIQDTNSKEIVGFISGIIIDLKIEDKTVKATEVNFLCVHKKFRNASMASVLIREVVRRSNLVGVFQGLFTSGTLLPTPFAQARYYHRNLNFRKLAEVRFTYLGPNQKLSTQEKLNQLPNKPELPAGSIFRSTEERDLKQIKSLVSKKLSQFNLYQNYTKKEIKHWFSHRPSILESYVIELNGKVTDFFCFYNLPSSVLKSEKHKEVKAAYSYYFVEGGMSLSDLYLISLHKAHELGYDVFNVLDVMNNKDVFLKLGFAGGDGFLNYYFYNYGLKDKYLMPNKIGIVLM